MGTLGTFHTSSSFQIHFKSITYQNSKINLLSIDIENHEFEALKNFDFLKYKIDVLVVENTDTNLKKLEISNSKITDEGIKKIVAFCPQLVYLNVWGITNITDKSLIHLRDLWTLENL